MSDAQQVAWTGRRSLRQRSAPGGRPLRWAQSVLPPSLRIIGTWDVGCLVLFFICTLLANKICFIFTPVLFKNTICTISPHCWVVFLPVHHIL